MSYLAISKWTRYQHYKTRKPPWIKFYVELVDDVQNKLNDLPVPTRYLFDRLLLLAAKYDNAIPKNPELIASLVRMDLDECREGIDELLKGRWIKETRSKRRASKGAIKMLAPETETNTEQEFVKLTTVAREPALELVKSEQVKKSTRPPADGFHTDRLIAAVRQQKPHTPAAIRKLSAGLPPSVIEDVRERLESRRSEIRNDAGWVLKELERIAGDRESA